MDSGTKVAAAERDNEFFEPTMDWTLEPEADTLIVYLPGFRKEQLKVQVTTAGTLRLSGERSRDGKTLSKFRKEVPLLSNYNVNGITAKFENGALYVKHPKVIVPAEPQQNTETPQKPPKPDAKPPQETTQPPTGTPESTQPPKPPQEKEQLPSGAPKPSRGEVDESTKPPKAPQDKEQPPSGLLKPPQGKLAETTLPPEPPQVKEQPPSIQAATEASKPDQKPSEEAGKKESSIKQERKSDSSNYAAEIDKNSKSSQKTSGGADELARENRQQDYSDLLVGLSKPSECLKLLLIVLLLLGFALQAWKSLRTPEDYPPVD